MKTVKLIVGIISIVLFTVIIFQSCATGIVTGISEAFGDESMANDTSGGAGVFLAFCMLIGGIIGVATRNSKAGGIVSGIFYLLAAIIGFANLGVFGDLVVWSVISLIFGLLFIIGSIMIKSPAKDYSAYNNQTPGQYPQQQQYQYPPEDN